MTHSIKTTTTIKKLKAAGYARNEFRVRTTTNKYGEDNETEIIIWTDKETQIARISAVVEAGIHVTRYTTEDGKEFYPTYQYKKAGITNVTV